MFVEHREILIKLTRDIGGCLSVTVEPTNDRHLVGRNLFAFDRTRDRLFDFHHFATNAAGDLANQVIDLVRCRAEQAGLVCGAACCEIEEIRKLF